MSFFECSANTVSQEEPNYFSALRNDVLPPLDNNGSLINNPYSYLCHTNHPLSNTDIHENAIISPTSLRRLDFLQDRMKDMLQEGQAPITEHHMMSLFAQAPLCLYKIPDDTGFTFGGWIVKIERDDPEEDEKTRASSDSSSSSSSSPAKWPGIYVSAGPPSIRDWVEVGKLL